MKCIYIESSNAKLPKSNVNNVGWDNSRLIAHDSCDGSKPLGNCFVPELKFKVGDNKCGESLKRHFRLNLMQVAIA